MDELLIQLITEGEQIQKSRFWQEYMREIEEYRRLTSLGLETTADDRFKGLQGEMRAIKKILKIPEDIINKLRNKGTTS